MEVKSKFRCPLFAGYKDGIRSGLYKDAKGNPVFFKKEQKDISVCQVERMGILGGGNIVCDVESPPQEAPDAWQRCKVYLRHKDENPLVPEVEGS